MELEVQCICMYDPNKCWVSSQLVTWPTRTQVNPYPGSPLVTTLEKSTRNQSLGYELTFYKFWRKLVPKHIPYQDIYDYINILFYYYVFILCIKCTTRWSKDEGKLKRYQRKSSRKVIIYILCILMEYIKCTFY